MNTKVFTPSITDELAQLERVHGGSIPPKAVVEFAKDPNTALHSQFEWDDGVAAEKWRLVQARRVLRVYVEPVDLGMSDKVTVRAYVSLPSDRKTGAGYRPIRDVLDNETWRKELLSTAKAELKFFRAKYKTLTELAEVHKAIDTLLDSENE